MKIQWKRWAAACLAVVGTLLASGCSSRDTHDHYAGCGHGGYYHYPHRVSHASYGHTDHHHTHYSGCGHKSVSYHYY